MTTFVIRHRLGVAHDRVAVYVGVDGDHLQLSGELMLHRDEVAAFWRLIGGRRAIDGVLEDVEVEPEIEVPWGW